MKEEKKVMQTDSSASEYTAPKVKVVTVKPRRVLCASGNEPTAYPGTSWDE